MMKRPEKKEFDPDATIHIELDENDSLRMRIDELKKQKEGILAFKDIIPADRSILEGINAEIVQLEEKIAQAKKMSFDNAKRSLFDMIDRTGGAYSPTRNQDYTPQEVKMIIEDVLTGEKEISHVPRSPIMGTAENLREKVQKLLNMNDGAR